MTTQAVIEPRKVIRGTLNESTGIYTLYLDNGAEVDTESEEIAKAASLAAKSGKWLLIETETKGGRAIITDFSEASSALTRKPDTAAMAKRPQLPIGLISDPLKLTEQLHAMERHYHVMSPAISISQMAQGYGANLAVVQIDPTVVFDEPHDPKSGTGPDCYWSKSIHSGDRNKRSLRKEGLLKLCQAIGVQWDPTHCRRLDDGKQRFFWRWQYFGYVRTHDGQVQPLQGSFELDLRDGGGDAVGMKAPQLNKARANGNEVCETKAMLRAIRTLRIQQSYTVDELKKPFLIVRFSFTPDMDDPEIKKAVTLQAMSGIGSLYAAPSAGALPPPLPNADLDEPGGDEPSAPAKKNPFEENAPANAPMPDGATTIVEVKRSSGVKRKEGKPPTPWSKYDVTFATGEIATTFSQSLQKVVDEAEQTKARVRIETSFVREGYNDNLDKIEIVDKRQQSLPDPGEL